MNKQVNRLWRRTLNGRTGRVQNDWLLPVPSRTWELRCREQEGILLLLLMFIYLFWEKKKEIAWVGEKGQGRERERIPGRLHAQPGAWCGAESHDPGIMTWAKIKSPKLNRLSHPGTPQSPFLVYVPLWWWFHNKFHNKLWFHNKLFLKGVWAQRVGEIPSSFQAPKNFFENFF